jgi:Cd2+/Zn2+-exporting ATPase
LFLGRARRAKSTGAIIGWDHTDTSRNGSGDSRVHEALEQRSRAGQTVVVVGSDQHVCGLIALADAIRPESADAIRQLKALGIKPVVMLTGDNRPTAEVLAARAGG